MNPPSALHSAMSRDRKPFTYTPGGLDLSEIKSERMAKRLMRNAMNQGVPEVPVQSVHSPSNPSAPQALPNFNCLPVQVFPTFNLPANPKSLLRTRSNPDPRVAPIQRVVPPFANNAKVDDSDTFNNNKYTPTYSQINNSRPVSMHEYTPSGNTYSLPRINNYGSDGYVDPLLPEISYEAEYFRAPPKLYSASEQLPKLEISEEKDELPVHNSVETNIDLTIKPLAEVTIPTIPIVAPTSVESKPAEENAGTENEQKEVRVVKKQVQKENKVEEQNGNQNGDATVEAEMTVKLPTKKSAAKTETKVEVVKKILPDGTVEEVKTTTTKTTVDGRTEIKTKTETRTIPKEDEESEEEVVEEEEEDGDVAVQEVQEEQEEEVEEPDTTTVTATLVAPKENGQESKVVKTEERSETMTTSTKKVVVVQDSPKEEQSVEVTEEEEVEEEEVEEVEEAEPVKVVLKKQVTPEPTPPAEEPQPVDEEEEEEVVDEVEEELEEEKKVVIEETKKEVEDEVEEKEVVAVTKEEVKALPPQNNEEEEEEEEEYEESEEKEETEVEVKQETEVKKTQEVKEDEQDETVEEEVEQEKEAVVDKPAEEPKETPKEPEEKIIKVEIQAPEEPKPVPREEKQEPAPIPIREPSIPLEKVEDVEIKPIGSTPIITKTHTENTEIITSTIEPKGGLSTQTEYNKIENIVTVNRTTKVLDHNYENLTQQGIPTVRTYFPPPSIDRISTSPLPSRPYQPVYPPEPTTERRHSLLLERLSMERQMPSDILQYGNQTYDQTQYPGEPRSEVLTVSNVKPSTITDQQWYQQKNQPNLIYNNVSSTPTPASQPWAQPKSQPQPQQQYQPQPQYQAQHQPQQQYQAPPQQQPQYQPPPTPKPQYRPSPTPQPQYQHSFSEPATERAPSSYSTYTPTPTWVSNTETLQNLTQPSQYSYLNKETSDSYQKSAQQYSSSYVPPPWEQDSSYTSVNNTSQVYYQPAPQTQSQSFSPAPAQGWKPPPSAKFTKNPPIAFIPPAPNQSFVRSASVVEPPRTPGRKTYYSEYERRYITVPESTYIPTENKYQPQPDPSPQYYYDNNEPTEQVEPQWRRELREFTEKTSQTTTTEQTSVQPPWEPDTKYPKTPSATAYTPTPTWSQTLRPRSWRERSFESDYVSQEWPKSNSLNRGRPLSTCLGVDAAIPERTRGVSVDRYNPNSYQSPAEHPPVQSHTLTTPVAHAGYHNPNVPAYHTRASAEPREQPTSYQPRVHREARASPLQSRSFKYLQWITGTDN